MRKKNQNWVNLCHLMNNDLAVGVGKGKKKLEGWVSWSAFFLPLLLFYFCHHHTHTHSHTMKKHALSYFNYCDFLQCFNEISFFYMFVCLTHCSVFGNWKWRKKSFHRTHISGCLVYLYYWYAVKLAFNFFSCFFFFYFSKIKKRSIYHF